MGLAEIRTLRLRSCLVLVAACAFVFGTVREYRLLQDYEVASLGERMNYFTSNVLRRDWLIAQKAHEAGAAFRPPDTAVLDQLEGLSTPTSAFVTRHRSWAEVAEVLLRGAAYWKAASEADRKLRIALEHRSLLHSWGVNLNSPVWPGTY